MPTNLCFYLPYSQLCLSFMDHITVLLVNWASLWLPVPHPYFPAYLPAFLVKFIFCPASASAQQHYCLLLITVYNLVFTFSDWAGWLEAGMGRHWNESEVTEGPEGEGECFGSRAEAEPKTVKNYQPRQTTAIKHTCQFSAVNFK